MKHIVIFLSFLALALTYSCSGQYDDIQDYATEETVYPGGYDEPTVTAGYERLEIDLLKAGRIPSKDIFLGKAKKTIVEYDDKVLTYDSVCSWLNITGLTVSKAYIFKIYTEDEFHNKSLSVQAMGTPYTSAERATLIAPRPMVTASPFTAELNWLNGLSSSVVRILGMKYSYVNAGGTTVRLNTTETVVNLENLTEGSDTKVAIEYDVIPLLNNKAILDNFALYDTITVKTVSTAEYLSTRIRSMIRYIDYFNGNVTLTNEKDPHFSHLNIRYTTNAGTQNTVRVEKDQTTFTLPDIKRGPESYPDMEYVFVPTGSTTEISTGYNRYPVAFVVYLPEKTYTISKSSYRQANDGAIGSAEFQGPNSNGNPNTVSISFLRAENGKLLYTISDLFGGFYQPGRNYGNAYISRGILAFDGVSSFSLIEGEIDPWSYGWQRTEGSYEESSGKISLLNYWASYVFYLFLE